MIEVTELTKAYPGKCALDRVSFKVEKGEVAGFLGLNGAGKTTTMRILSCFLAPTAGTATVAGFDVVRQSMDVRRRVGYLPESNPLYTEMRVEEYLSFRARIKGVDPKSRATRVDRVLERVSLSDRRRSVIQHLSKGLRQRVGLADAIVHDPEIIILDEPTIGLDPTQLREIRDLIRELGKEHTILFSSHILSEVEKVCGRVIIINEGKVVEQGTLHDIAARHMKSNRIRLEIRGDGRAIKEVLATTPGVGNLLWSPKGDMNTYLVESLDGKDVRPELFRCCTAQGWEVYELGFERRSLEEVFHRLTEGASDGVAS
jgi:ABC-2 type transport system ATP-binding protein